MTPRDTCSLTAQSSIIGSGLGGCLADPTRNYPGVFPPGGILEMFPFLLPNVVSALVVLFGLVVGLLFLEETHEQKKNQRDLGLEIGKWLLRACKFSSSDEYRYSKLADASLDENEALMDDSEQPPHYRSNESSPRLIGRPCDVDPKPAEQPLDTEATSSENSKGAASALTLQVMLSVVAYGVLA